MIMAAKEMHFISNATCTFLKRIFFNVFYPDYTLLKFVVLVIIARNYADLKTYHISMSIYAKTSL